MARRPHAFKAVYTVTLHGEQLRTDLRVLNTGDAPFDFTAALHTYIEVLDIKVGCMARVAACLPSACVGPQECGNDHVT